MKKIPRKYVEIILNKIIYIYNTKRDILMSNFPDLVGVLDKLFSTNSVSRTQLFGITENYKNELIKELKLIIEEKDKLSRESAIKGLENYIILVVNRYIPTFVSRKDIVKLLEVVINEKINNVKRNTEFKIKEGKVYKEIAILYGVTSYIDEDYKILKISIFPHKYKNRCKLMKFVGIAKDSKNDVARQHNFYLTQSN